jgi:hypothetical protein
MNRAYYSDTISNFKITHVEAIIGVMALASKYSDEPLQKDAWVEEIRILQDALVNYNGSIYFEYSIPRMGQRIDVVLIIEHVIFILEFKVGEKDFPIYAIDQVWDYALDLKNFHETSHDKYIVPVLIATNAKVPSAILTSSIQNDRLFEPVRCNVDLLGEVIKVALGNVDVVPIDISAWEQGRYSPTPTIIEAAMALYNGHSVSEISRSDASAINLSKTSDAISTIINYSKENNRKSICFITGVPGAGKTLVGLNIVTTNFDQKEKYCSVFLSGNGPLVNILREALARDKVQHAKQSGMKLRKGEAMSEVKLIIQNIYHFRDEYLLDLSSPPVDHVALFDEAQRAWNIEQIANFMHRKRKRPNFSQSEPEFLISCLDRHPDWAVIVCLVGGGQEINTGEAGIGEWVESLNRSFPNWDIYISPKLTDSEYSAGLELAALSARKNVSYNEDLHLAVSMRSFRAEHVSLLVKQLLDQDVENARETLDKIKEKYPIAITRDLKKAKEWLKNHARGSERYGIVVSSQAERLKPHAIDVRSPMDPIQWFLNGKEDVRSSYYLEDVATEFSIQGLELDWCCITWDADFRYSTGGWEHRSFKGDRWYNINKEDRKKYQKNAYRVLLTRARQGMVIVVPSGDGEDPTRDPSFYDPTFNYLQSIGFEVLT